MEKKLCKKCNEHKNIDVFQKWRHTCNSCRYKQKKKLNKTYEISVTEKECFTCKVVKSYLEFYEAKKLATGLMTNCKDCHKKRASRQYIKRSDKVKKKVKEYRVNNREKVRLTKRAYHKKKFDTDPRYRLTRRLRCRLKDALRKKSWKKNTHFAEYIGCNLDFLKAHIEKQFKTGMSWANQGKWHLDHIIPLSSANTEEELYKLCHYSNIQPLWAEDNNAKSDKIL